jgi:AcrR family transcriptional regulator
VTTPTTPSRQPAIGRPPATDHDAIALAAVELFLERGYDAVTMDDIAGAAGISRTTLWRYFRTKGEILWGHNTERLGETQAALAAQPAEVSLAEGAVNALRSTLAAHPGESAFNKTQIRLIVGAPSSATSIWTTYQAWGRVVVEYVASRRGGSPDNLANQVAGMMLWAAIWAAYVHWACSDDPTADPYLDRLLAALPDISL